jgi:hypothetical protein
MLIVAVQGRWLLDFLGSDPGQTLGELPAARCGYVDLIQALSYKALLSCLEYSNQTDAGV